MVLLQMPWNPWILQLFWDPSRQSSGNCGWKGHIEAQPRWLLRALSQKFASVLFAQFPISGVSKACEINDGRKSRGSQRYTWPQHGWYLQELHSVFIPKEPIFCRVFIRGGQKRNCRDKTLLSDWYARRPAKRAKMNIFSWLQLSFKSPDGDKRKII